MDIALRHRRALVTGGNSGIGEATVRALAEAGASVAVNCVSHPDEAASLVDELKKAGAMALAVEATVRCGVIPPEWRT